MLAACHRPIPSVPVNRRLRFRLIAPGLVGLLLASNCAGATQAAIEVDGHELSRPDLNEMVVALGSDQSLQANLGFVDPHNGVHDLGAVALVFGLFVQRVFIDDTLERYDESVTEADEEEAFLEMGEQISAEASDVLLPLFAPVMAMRRLMLENPDIDPDLPFGDRYSTTVIRIDPRFGSWQDSGFQRPS
jgi:hypothetical protein